MKADDFVKELQEVIADENVHIDIINTFDASTSPLDTEMYKALMDILTENYPDVQVLPTISAGFTDSRLFRKKGTICYGILPFVADIEILSTMHGHDERISVEGFEKGIKVIFELVERLCV